MAAGCSPYAQEDAAGDPFKCQASRKAEHQTFPSHILGNGNGRQEVVASDHHNTDASATSSNHRVRHTITSNMQYVDTVPQPYREMARKGLIKIQSSTALHNVYMPNMHPNISQYCSSHATLPHAYQTQTKHSRDILWLDSDKARSGSIDATRPIKRNCLRQASNFWSVEISAACGREKNYKTNFHGDEKQRSFRSFRRGKGVIIVLIIPELSWLSWLRGAWPNLQTWPNSLQRAPFGWGPKGLNDCYKPRRNRTQLYTTKLKCLSEKDCVSFVSFMVLQHVSSLYL